MHEVAKSDLTTGNKHYASYAIQSNEITMVFTSPYSNKDVSGSVFPHPNYDLEVAHKFIKGIFYFIYLRELPKFV